MHIWLSQPSAPESGHGAGYMYVRKWGLRECLCLISTANNTLCFQIFVTIFRNMEEQIQTIKSFLIWEVGKTSDDNIYKRKDKIFEVLPRLLRIWLTKGGSMFFEYYDVRGIAWQTNIASWSVKQICLEIEWDVIGGERDIKSSALGCCLTTTPTATCTNISRDFKVELVIGLGWQASWYALFQNCWTVWKY